MNIAKFAIQMTFNSMGAVAGILGLGKQVKDMASGMGAAADKAAGAMNRMGSKVNQAASQAQEAMGKMGKGATQWGDQVEKAAKKAAAAIDKAAATAGKASKVSAPVAKIVPVATIPSPPKGNVIPFMPENREKPIAETIGLPRKRLKKPYDLLPADYKHPRPRPGKIIYPDPVGLAPEYPWNVMGAQPTPPLPDMENMLGKETTAPDIYGVKPMREPGAKEESRKKLKQLRVKPTERLKLMGLLRGGLPKPGRRSFSFPDTRRYRIAPDDVASSTYGFAPESSPMPEPYGLMPDIPNAIPIPTAKMARHAPMASFAPMAAPPPMANPDTMSSPWWWPWGKAPMGKLEQPPAAIPMEQPPAAIPMPTPPMGIPMAIPMTRPPDAIPVPPTAQVEPFDVSKILQMPERRFGGFGQDIDRAAQTARRALGKFAQSLSGPDLVEGLDKLPKGVARQAKELAEIIKEKYPELAAEAERQGKKLVKATQGGVLLAATRDEKGNITHRAIENNPVMDAKGEAEKKARTRANLAADLQEKELAAQVADREARQARRAAGWDKVFGPMRLSNSAKLEGDRLAHDAAEKTRRAGEAAEAARAARTAAAAAGVAPGAASKLTAAGRTIGVALGKGVITGFQLAIRGLWGAVSSTMQRVMNIINHATRPLLHIAHILRVTSSFSDLFGGLGMAGLAVGGVTAFKAGMADILDMDKKSRELGSTITDLRAAMLGAGTASESMLGGLNSLAEQTALLSRGDVDVARNFERIGALSGQKFAAGFADKEVTAQFGELAERISNIQDPTKQAAAAASVFGEDWVKILPVLQRGAEGMEQAREMATRLGLAVNSADLGNVRAVAESMHVLGLAWEGLRNQFVLGMSPVLAELKKAFDTSGVDFSQLKDRIVDGMEVVAQAAAVVMKIFSDTALMKEGWDLIFSYVKEGFKNVMDEVIQYLTNKLTVGFKVAKIWFDYVTSKEAFMENIGLLTGRMKEAQNPDTDPADKMPAIMGPPEPTADDRLKAFGDKLKNNPFLDNVNNFFGNVRNRMQPQAELMGPPEMGFSPKKVNQLTTAWQGMSQAIRSPLETFDQAQRDMRDFARMGKFEGPGGEDLKKRMAFKSGMDLIGAINVQPITQLAGAASAGSREAYSTIAQHESMRGRSTVQEQIKLALDEANRINAEQLQMGKELIDAVKNLRPLEALERL